MEDKSTINLSIYIYFHISKVDDVSKLLNNKYGLNARDLKTHTHTRVGKKRLLFLPLSSSLLFLFK